MKRRTLILVAALAACIAPLRSGAFAAERRPNIVFLLTDDQRADTLGCMGNQIIQTPNIDKLAARGVTFDNAFVTTAICMTNRACIFTGQYAARHGVIDFRTSFTAEQLAATYPALLKQAGYRIGFIGKWGVGDPPADLFHYNRGFPGQGRYFVEYEGKTRHLTGVVGDQAMEFLDGCKPDEPFCLSISFKAPHVQDTSDVNAQAFPFDPALSGLYEDVTIPVPKLAASQYYDRLPDFLKDSENRARWAVRFWGPQRYQFSVKSYYRLISGVDAAVGRIIEKLRQKGFADNTIVIFTSDHGFYLGEYGYAGKWYAHEVSIRIPLIVFDPRLPESQRGTRRDQTALSIDMAPTMLALGGIKPHDRMQGRDIMPLVRNEPVDPAWRDTFFYEHNFAHARIPRNEGVRTPRWKYMRFIDSQPLYEELYDLQADPIEEHNLAADPAHAPTLNAMREQWRTWRERVK